MNSPLVSIGLPVYNGGKSLARALNSILVQDFGDFEIVISDNASTDETRMIGEDYARRDTRIRYFVNETNIGANPNHNRVFRASQGKYFCWMADDVEYLPGMLGRCVQEMNAAPAPPVLAYPLCEQINEAGVPVQDDASSVASHDARPHRRASTVIQRIGFVTQHYGLFVAEALRKTRLNGSYPASDRVLTAEMAMLGEIREIPEVLIRRQLATQGGTRAVLHDQNAWAGWLDTAMKGRHFVLGVEDRLAWEYFRAAWCLPLKPMDKLRCCVAGPYAHYRRLLLDDLAEPRVKFGRLRRRWLKGLQTAWQTVI